MKNEKIIEELLKLSSSVLIGSRGLNVSETFSDWDIAVLASEIPEGLLNPLKKLKVEKYFSVLPLGNTQLYRGEKLDVLVYKTEEQLKVIKKALDDLRNVPKYLLRNKYVRIILFENALVHYGFILVKKVSF